MGGLPGGVHHHCKGVVIMEREFSSLAEYGFVQVNLAGEGLE